METIAVMTKLKRITVGEYVSDYENIIENKDEDEIILKEYTEEEVLKHNFKNIINLREERKYIVTISGEIIGLRRSKRRRNKKKVCYI